MKNYYISVFSILLLIFLSCNDDEGTVESAQVPAPSIDVTAIVGKWKTYTQEYRNYGNYSELPYLVSGCATNRYDEYTADVVNDITYESLISNASNDVIENGFVIRDPVCTGNLELRHVSGYTIQGNLIYYTNEDNSISIVKIESLNQQQMILQWNDDLSNFINWKYRAVYTKF